jgi:YesN/AraC family two-component response regulator
VEEIAELVGISAPQTLYRLFKENEGMTISEYRKYHRQS